MHSLYLIGALELPKFLNSDLIQHLIEVVFKTVLLTLILILAFIIVNRLYKFIDKIIERLGRKVEVLGKLTAKKIRLARKDLIQAEVINDFIKRVITWSKFIVSGSILLIYLNSILSLFPLTQSISHKVFESILSSIGQILQGLISYVPKFTFLIILSLMGFYSLKLIRFIFKEIEIGYLAIPGFDPEWSKSTSRIVQFFTIILFVVVGFPYLPGADSDVFGGISIFIGILFSIGSSSVIADIVAGILLTYTRAFRVGDEVQIDGIIGFVVEKRFLNVSILDETNRFISIPNSKVLNSNVINLRGIPNPKDENYPIPIIHIRLEIPHENNWQDVYKILLEAALETNDILNDPEPLVLLTQIDNFYTVYTLQVFTHKPTSLLVNSELLCKIKEKLSGSSINLEAPQYILKLLKQKP